MKYWLARDSKDFPYNNKEQGNCFLYAGTKPEKCVDGEFWKQYISSQYIFISDDKLPEGINPQWEDDEPIEVELCFRPVKQ